MSNITPMRIIFMGSPAFALPTLQALQSAGHEIVAVYTQPPRPANRGQKITPCAVHEYAESQGLNVLTPENFKSEAAQKQLADFNADVGVVVAYGLILPKTILSATKYGFLNLHPSLLPRWRGAAPIQRPLLEGDTETAATIMQMDEGCDTGDILLYKKIPITPESTTASLQDELGQLGAELMVHALVGLEHKLLKPIKQNDKDFTYAAKLEKEDGKIEWKAMPAVHIDRMVRALNPWPGVHFTYGGEQIKILKASVAESTYRAKPGEVVTSPEVTGGAPLCVGTRDGMLRIDEIQRPSRKPATAEEFLRGLSIPEGTIFG
jgi:methionyl-tRNA formyltransferase